MAKHYIQINEQNEIISGFSDVLQPDIPTDALCIDENGERHFSLLGESNPVLKDHQGIYLYVYENKKVKKKSNTVITAEINQKQFTQTKQVKLAEMNQTCEAVIEQGVTVETGKGIKTFSLSTKDQINLMGLSAKLQSGDPSLANGVPYHANGELCEPWSIEEFMMIANTATNYVFYHTTYVNYLKAYINHIKKTEELEAVYYGMPLPEDLQTQMNALLGGAT